MADESKGIRRKGERGKRGKRGHRGHRGHDGIVGVVGPDGATGPTGATGPSGGPTGDTGAAGTTGATGPSGPAGTGGLMKFSGIVASSISSLVVDYLADTGFGLGASSIIAVPISYPAAVARTLRNFTANVQIVIPVLGSMIFDLIVNGSVVSTIIYNPGDSGIKSATPFSTPVAIGQTIDVRVSSGGFTDAAIQTSATVGVE